MLRVLRNLTVNLMAVFIRDRDARHKFRNKYKRKSKFRKLRDDNKRLFNENKILQNDIIKIKSELAILKERYSQHLFEEQRLYTLTYHVEPLDNQAPLYPESEVYLAIACVAKNEGQYIKEWIEYHKIVGVERFYFYDNESDDNTKSILEPYIKEGTVVYHFLPNHKVSKKVPQIEAYNDAIFKYRDNTRWMAIIDIDEFIVPVEKETVTEFLTDYENYPGVVINWVMFDCNGHDTKPKEHGGLVTANYIRTSKNLNNYAQNKIAKSIVNPKLVVQYISNHYGLYYLNFEAVTENFQKTRGVTTKLHSSNKIRINHYYTKSREEYTNKLIKHRQGNQSTSGYKFNEELLNFSGGTTEDLIIQKYVPKLKRVLGVRD